MQSTSPVRPCSSFTAVNDSGNIEIFFFVRRDSKIFLSLKADSSAVLLQTQGISYNRKLGSARGIEFVASI